MDTHITVAPIVIMKQREYNRYLRKKAPTASFLDVSIITAIANSSCAQVRLPRNYVTLLF